MEHLYPRCGKQIVSPISKSLLLKSWQILRSILSITIIQHLYIVLVTLHETTRRRRKEGGNTHIRSDQHLTFTHFMLVPRSILFQSHFNHNGRPMGHKRECRTEGMNKQKRWGVNKQRPSCNSQAPFFSKPHLTCTPSVAVVDWQLMSAPYTSCATGSTQDGFPRHSCPFHSPGQYQSRLKSRKSYLWVWVWFSGFKSHYRW